MENKKPRVFKKIDSCSVQAGHSVYIDIKTAFLPNDGSLNFKLTAASPDWLYADKKDLCLKGDAPLTKQGRRYVVAIEASNEFGKTTQRFYIRVTRIPAVDALANTLLSSFDLPDYHYLHGNNPYVHELLEYLYGYFQASIHDDAFNKLIKENAEELGIEISSESSYEDFKKVIKQLNPSVEEDLKKRFSGHMLLEEGINNTDFRNLFRQGSQPLGTYPLAVWNYLAAPDRYDWSHTSNVLDEASEASQEIKEENKEENTSNKNLFKNRFIRRY